MYLFIFPFTLSPPTDIQQVCPLSQPAFHLFDRPPTLHSSSTRQLSPVYRPTLPVPSQDLCLQWLVPSPCLSFPRRWVERGPCLVVQKHFTTLPPPPTISPTPPLNTRQVHWQPVPHNGPQEAAGGGSKSDKFTCGWRTGRDDKKSLSHPNL